MNYLTPINVESNIKIIARARGGSIIEEREIHNIVTNIGRQFLAEVITPATLGGGGSFTRTTDEVVRYIGFGMGGTLQSAASASAPPFSTDYPGTNLQTDTDLTVSGLERPVAVSGTINTPGIPAPAVWMNQIATPGTFPSATTTRFVALFTATDINFGAYTSVPLSEIALYRGDADDTLPNGTSGTYPGTGGLIIAYDTFNTIQKTGVFSLEVRWEFRF